MPIIIPLVAAATRDAVTASPAKTFEQAYILDLVVNANHASPNDSIHISYCPFDQESGERLLTEKRGITVPFWQIMEELPEAALAFKAVSDALPLLIAHKKQADEDAEDALMVDGETA
jgi:hypothetical protein